MESLPSLANEICSEVLNSLNIFNYLNMVEISIMFVDDEYIHNLNKQYRQNDKPTNVLSFPLHDIDYTRLQDIETLNGYVMLGDIFLSYDSIVKESKEQGKIFKDHLVHLLIHGILHLLGYDHIEDEEADFMEKTEIMILKNMGIQSPYNSLYLK